MAHRARTMFMGFFRIKKWGEWINRKLKKSKEKTDRKKEEKKKALSDEIYPLY
jgi:hypothetical protein